MAAIEVPLQSRSVENGAAFPTGDFVARGLALTPTLSQGERGLSEQAVISRISGPIAISCYNPAPRNGRVGRDLLPPQWTGLTQARIQHLTQRLQFVDARLYDPELVAQQFLQIGIRIGGALDVL